MKLDAVLALVKPYLATDAKPAEIKAAILAADKAAKDEFPEKDDKAAKDKKAGYDKARDSMTKDEKEAFDAAPDDEKDKIVKDRAAKDAEGDPENTNDTEIEAEDEVESGTPAKGGPNRKPALDAKVYIEQRVAAAVATAVAGRDQLYVAAREVEPIVGTRTFDSAGAAYKAGLEALGVDLEGVPESAYRAMLKLAKDRSTPAPIAMDSASIDEVRKLIPHYGRL